MILWTLYEYFITILIIVLISPRIEHFKAKEFEIKMLSPPSPEFVLSPAAMELKLKKLSESLGMTPQKSGQVVK